MINFLSNESNKKTDVMFSNEREREKICLG